MILMQTVKTLLDFIVARVNRGMRGLVGLAQRQQKQVNVLTAKFNRIHEGRRNLASERNKDIGEEINSKVQELYAYTFSELETEEKWGGKSSPTVHLRTNKLIVYISNGICQ